MRGPSPVLPCKEQPLGRNLTKDGEAAQPSVKAFQLLTMLNRTNRIG